MKRPRILLADDHMLLTDAFTKLLEPQYQVVATVTDGLSLLDRAPALKPDLILLDLSMPGLNGLDAARQLRKLIPGVKIIIITMLEDVHIALKAMNEGASGYLLKKAAGSELLQAIQVVLRRGKYVTPQIAREMENVFELGPEGESRIEGLSSRQRQVLQLLAEGKSMKQAGAILCVTPRTIAFHKYRMMKTLRIRSSAELVQYAVKHQLL